jgi:MYXO-CTERM domain-containing protein
LTEVLNMYPLAGGSENINLNMYDFVTGDGEFNLDETGYVGFGFGSGVDFNYGWIELTVYAEGSSKWINMTGWAYNDVVNESITVGQIPAPGALGLLAIAGLAGRRRRRG